MKRQTIRPSFVVSAPRQLDEGVIYISDRFHTALHKCCCGCGREVVTPLNPAKWSYIREGEFVTLKPSIGNWSFPCKSHYWIIKNEIAWAGAMSARQIAAVKVKDRRDQDAFISCSNQKKSIDNHGLNTPSPGRSWLMKLLKILRSWFSL